MASPPTRRTGREIYNGFEINLYGFLPDQLIFRDQEAASLGIADFWDPGNGRTEEVGASGKTRYAYISIDKPKPFTVAVFSGAQVLADDGYGVMRDQSGADRGTVTYETGRVDITFATAAEHPVFMTYSTGEDVEEAQYWDQDGKIWDRLAEAPVIQKTFWAIELDALDLVQTIDAINRFAYADTAEPAQLKYMFDGWGFNGQIVEVDADKLRQWLREMSTFWKLKNAYRMWLRLLENLGFDATLYVLYKRHPLNNYGVNPNELYSRTLNEITLEQQEAYEELLKDAGYDPTAVADPVSGDEVTVEIGVGQNETTANIRFPVARYAPEWSTVVIQRYTESGGLSDWEFVFNSTTGDITINETPGGTQIGSGSVNLTTGIGRLSFGTLSYPAFIVTTESTFRATYSEIGTPYQAARVDLVVDVGDEPGYAAGDRAADAVERAIEYVRPIHVIVRRFEYRQSVNEEAGMNEGDCCGPNQGRIQERDYPETAYAQPMSGGVGIQLYGGSVLNPPIVRGSFRIVSGAQVIVGDRIGNLIDTATNDIVGYVDSTGGSYKVNFPSPTTVVPLITYQRYDATADADSNEIHVVADAPDIGEAKFDRSAVELATTYADEDIDSAYKNIIGDIATFSPAVVLVGPNDPAVYLYKGTLPSFPVIPGSVSISDAAARSMSDDGVGNLVGDAGFGTVDYDTGVYILQFNNTIAMPSAFNIAYTEMSGPPTRFSGTLVGGIVPGTVYFRDPVNGQIVQDDGAGNLVGDIGGAGTNTVTYATGAFDFSFAALPGAEIYAVYEFSSPGAHVANAEDVRVVFAEKTYPESDYVVIHTDTDVTERRVRVTRSVTPDKTLLDRNYAGNLVQGVITETVRIEDSGSGQVVTDDGSGNLTGDVDPLGTNTVNYATGAYDFTFALTPADTNPTIRWESLKVGDPGSKAYSGEILPPLNYRRGTLDFTEDAAAQSLKDTDGETTMSGDGTGSFDYISGDISVAFTKVAQSDPYADYRYYDADGFVQKGRMVLGSAGSTAYAATLPVGQVVPGSVIVVDRVGGQQIQDDGVVELQGDGSGTFNYLTGAYDLEYTLASTTFVRAALSEQVDAAY